MSKNINPETEGVHPLRLELSDDDWDRIERVIVDKSKEQVSSEELEAYMDYLYDVIASKKQTVEGVTTLQQEKSMTDFRLFCNEMWFQHKDEILDWTGNLVQYDSTYYFRKHRWLLKAKFKEQKNDT